MSLIGADFQRVRIGIGHPGRKELVSGYVLHDFAKADQQWTEDLLEGMARHLDPLIAGDAPRIMNDVACFMNPQRSSVPKQSWEVSRQPGRKMEENRQAKEANPAPGKQNASKETGHDFRDVLGSLKDKFKK